MILSIVIFILVLSVLVFVHELGHFLVAKACGMRVDEFAIGFPPRIWGVKKGETLYAINAIPLGGYVRIHGEGSEDDVDHDPKSFQNKSVWARIAVIVAGVVMNLLFAFLLLCILFITGSVTSGGLGLETIPGAQVKEGKVLVVQVQDKSPAQKAGLLSGDTLKQLTVTKTGEIEAVHNIKDVQALTKKWQLAGTDDISVQVDRAGTIMNLKATIASSGPALGVGIEDLSRVQLPFWRAPQGAIKVMWVTIQNTWDALGQFASNLFFHAQLDKDISGPIGIYHATASAAQQGAVSVLFLIIILSVNLALLNILPFPPLDGGKFLFLLIELIFRRRIVRQRAENTIAAAGMIVLLIIIVLVSINDIRAFF